jgi:hypothetical protein
MKKFENGMQDAEARMFLEHLRHEIRTHRYDGATGGAVPCSDKCRSQKENADRNRNFKGQTIGQQHNKNKRAIGIIHHHDHAPQRDH